MRSELFEESGEVFCLDLDGEEKYCFGSSSSSGQVSRVMRGSPVCEGERGQVLSGISSSGMSPLRIAARASSEITGVFLRFALICFMTSEIGDFGLTRISRLVTFGEVSSLFEDSLGFGGCKTMEGASSGLAATLASSDFVALFLKLSLFETPGGDLVRGVE